MKTVIYAALFLVFAMVLYFSIIIEQTKDFADQDGFIQSEYQSPHHALTKEMAERNKSNQKSLSKIIHRVQTADTTEAYYNGLLQWARMAPEKALKWLRENKIGQPHFFESYMAINQFLIKKDPIQAGQGILQLKAGTLRDNLLLDYMSRMEEQGQSDLAFSWALDAQLEQYSIRGLQAAGEAIAYSSPNTLLQALSQDLIKLPETDLKTLSRQAGQHIIRTGNDIQNEQQLDDLLTRQANSYPASTIAGAVESITQTDPELVETWIEKQNNTHIKQASILAYAANSHNLQTSIHLINAIPDSVKKQSILRDILSRAKSQDQQEGSSVQTLINQIANLNQKQKQALEHDFLTTQGDNK